MGWPQSTGNFLHMIAENNLARGVVASQLATIQTLALAVSAQPTQLLMLPFRAVDQCASLKKLPAPSISIVTYQTPCFGSPLSQYLIHHPKTVIFFICL